MSNRLHETNETSPQNQPEGENDGNTSAIGVSEKTMKLIVIVLGVLLLFGFLLVVGTIIYRVINLESDVVTEDYQQSSYEIVQTPNTVAYGSIEVAKPRSSTLTSFEVDGGLIYFHFTSETGVESMKIVRLNDGMVMGSVGFVDEQQ